MKKKIAIWCCLAVVLAIFVYFFVDWLVALIEFKKFFQTLDEILSADKVFYESYIEYIFSLTISIIGIIITILVMCLVYTFKDITTEEIKEKLQQLKTLNKSKKIEKNKKRIEKLNQEIENLK